MTRTTVASVTFLVGTGLGFLIGLNAGRDRAIPPQKWFLSVGDSASQVSGPAKAPISRSKGDTVVWKSTRDWPLTIYFRKDQLPTDNAQKKLPPFQSMEDMGDRWVVKPLTGGTAAWRYSGPINRDLGLSSTTKLEFKYWQILVDPTTGKPDEADGRIIIQW